jgi:peroxiredoxin
VNSYVASDYGVAFALTHEEQELFVAAGNDLARVNGHGAWLLPAPSLFVIDRTGVIRYVHVDPDYTRRIDPRELLGALRGL